MKYKETRILTSTALRALCIRESWYTRGDNAAYHRILQYASSRKNITTANLAHIAEDIIDHSKMDGGWEVEDVMHAINKVCSTYFSRVDS